MAQIPSGKTEEEQKLVLAKRQVEKLSLEFHKLLDNKKLTSNKTQGELKMETDVGYRLIQAANDLDVLKHPEPEGTFTLLMLFAHISIIMRDRNNELDHKISDLNKTIEKLKRSAEDRESAGQRNG